MMLVQPFAFTSTFFLAGIYINVVYLFLLLRSRTGNYQTGSLISNQISSEHLMHFTAWFITHYYGHTSYLFCNTCSIAVASMDHTRVLSGYMVEHSWYVSEILLLHTCSIPVLSLDHTWVLPWWSIPGMQLGSCCFIPVLYLWPL
jgi:hypothetical protein